MERGRRHAHGTDIHSGDAAIPVLISTVGHSPQTTSQPPARSVPQAPPTRTPYPQHPARPTGPTSQLEARKACMLTHACHGTHEPSHRKIPATSADRTDRPTHPNLPPTRTQRTDRRLYDSLHAAIHSNPTYSTVSLATQRTVMQRSRRQVSAGSERARARAPCSNAWRCCHCRMRMQPQPVSGPSTHLRESNRN